MGKNSNIPKINISQKPTYVQCATDIDFHKLFQVIEESSQCCFLLESLGENGHTSRYSVIGFDPVHKIYARGLLLFFDGTPYETENPYFALQEITPQTAIARRYSGGLVGYLGYECINYFEPTLQVKPNPLFNQFSFGVFTDGLVLDKATQEVFYFYYDTNRMDQVETFLSQKATLRRVSIKLIGDELSEKEHAENVLYVKREI